MKFIRSSSRRGIMLIDCLIYIALLAVVFGLALATFYRALTNSDSLRRNASDIVRTLRAGEQWRADIRGAAGAVEIAASDLGQLLSILQATNQVFYQFRESAVWRRAGGNAAWVPILPKVKSSHM